MYDSWTCVMVKNGPGLIDEDVKCAIKMAACDLFQRKIERNKLRNDVCEGYIQTEWKSRAVGARSGILFHAHITADDGDYQVNFLLSEDDLERGAEFVRDIEERQESTLRGNFRVPVEELYVFKDLRKHKLN